MQLLAEEAVPVDTLDISAAKELLAQSQSQLASASTDVAKAEAEISGLSWLFSQSQTKYPAKGTYIYKLSLQSETDNSVATTSGKIVIK